MSTAAGLRLRAVGHGQQQQQQYSLSNDDGEHDAIVSYRKAWRAILHVDDMKSGGFKTGEPLLVQCDTAAVAVLVAWPTISESGRGCIGLSPSARYGCGAKLDDMVNVMKPTDQSNAVSASSIVLQLPDTEQISNVDLIVATVREVLMDIKYALIGTRIPVRYAGRQISLTVANCNGASAADAGSNVVYQLARSTSISTIRPTSTSTAASASPQSQPHSQQNNQQQQPQRQQHTKGSGGFASIGGLESQVSAVREMVDYALLRPEIFQQYGLRPPRGVLLVGPSGTGKTLIASAVVAESGVRHFVINGADVVGKYYGEAEQRLRNVFEEAVIYGPSIIYIDEIDALCPRRDNSTNEQDKRIVATLLTLMDGVEGDDDSTKNKKPFFVIAATNRPNALDDALRRPGRFDREIDVGIPPPADRVSIMRTLMARHPHTLSDGELSDIALACHGFTGADLSAMIKEAGLIAIHRHLDSSVEQPTDSLFITAADISSAKARIVPSAMRQVSVEVPKVYWSDIGGQSDIKQRMRESIEWPLRHPERFTRLGIKPPKGILMYGPPGCSKTLTAKALATESGLNFIAVKGPELFSKWVGESEKAVRAVFQRARQASPAIVFFDEIDAIATARSGATSGGSGGGNGGSGGGNSVSDRVLSQLLVELDGIEPLVNVLVVAATNRPDVLDPALLRPGRIDRILYVGPPDADARSEIFKIRFKKTMVADDVDAMELAQMTDGFSGAEIVSVCQEAAMAALEEDISAQAVCKRHFIKAIANTPKRITPDMVAFYDRFRKQSGLNEI